MSLMIPSNWAAKLHSQMKYVWNWQYAALDAMNANRPFEWAHEDSDDDYLSD